MEARAATVGSGSRAPIKIVDGRPRSPWSVQIATFVGQDPRSSVGESVHSNPHF